jgi:hypothetical protein
MEEVLRRALVVRVVGACLLAACVLVIAAGVWTPASATPAPPRTPAAQDEFVPVSELPDVEQLPAAPLLLTAYAAFWIAAFLYLWSIRRRMASLDRDLADLRRRLAEVEPPGTR